MTIGTTVVSYWSSVDIMSLSRTVAEILSAKNKLHCLTERDSRLANYFAVPWGMGLILGYLAISGAKSDVIFLLGDADFL